MKSMQQSLHFTATLIIASFNFSRVKPDECKMYAAAAAIPTVCKSISVALIPKRSGAVDEQVPYLTAERPWIPQTRARIGIKACPTDTEAGRTPCERSSLNEQSRERHLQLRLKAFGETLIAK